MNVEKGVHDTSPPKLTNLFLSTGSMQDKHTHTHIYIYTDREREIYMSMYIVMKTYTQNTKNRNAQIQKYYNHLSRGRSSQSARKPRSYLFIELGAQSHHLGLHFRNLCSFLLDIRPAQHRKGQMLTTLTSLLEDKFMAHQHHCT
mgnify:CR=1 FL=1